MGLKKSFAKNANSYQREMKDALTEVGPLVLFPAAIIGVAIGFGGLTATDAFKPVNDDPHLGQGIAIQQHQAAITELAQQHKALQDAQSAAHFTPQSLGTIIDLSEEDQNNKGTAIETESHYKTLLDAFVTSVHVDKRLNEADAQTLLQAFETEHGDIEDVTSFKNGLDYNDLDEARAQVGDRQNGESEQEFAQSINKQADKANDWTAFWVVGGTTTALPFLASILFAMMGGPLRRWERDVPKPRNNGKFNH